jgi:DNA anti-recombination protein RmuC
MAYLETIRHSMKLFSLQTDTKNILSTHEKVKNEIRKFLDSFDETTKKLDQTVKAFDSLKTTRVNKLEKSFEELDEVNKKLSD